MRAKQIEIDGKLYWITYAVSVELALEARGMNPAKLKTDPSTTLVMAMLGEMLKAGYRWAVRTGETALEPPAEKDLADVLTMIDLRALLPDMAEVINGERHVIAKAGKGKKEGAGTSGG